MLIDWEHGDTYVYATAASGLLPALAIPPPVGVFQAAHPTFPGIVQRRYGWPGGKSLEIPFVCKHPSDHIIL